jgi:predicted nucleotidyltransferase
MAKNKIRKVIKFLEERLGEKNLNISKIILFGSQVKGRGTPESDIDLVIVSEDFHGKDIFERTRLIKEPEIMTIKKFMIPLDIITLTPEEFESETSLIAEYAKKGEVLFPA